MENDAVNDLRQAAKQALEYIVNTNKNSQFWLVPESSLNKTVTALKQALNLPEQLPMVEIETVLTVQGRPEQEPVAHLWQHSETGRTRVVMPDQVITADATWFVVGPLYLYTAPTPRKPLTDLEILAANKFMYNQHPCVYIQEDGEPENLIAFARAIERKHDIKE